MTASADRFFDVLLEDAVRGHGAPDLVAATLARAAGASKPRELAPIHQIQRRSNWRQIMQAAAIVIVAGLAAWIALAPGKNEIINNTVSGTNKLTIEVTEERVEPIKAEHLARDGYTKAVGVKELEALPEDSKQISLFELRVSDLHTLDRFKVLEGLEVTFDPEVKEELAMGAVAKFLGAVTSLSRLKALALRNCRHFEDDWVRPLSGVKLLNELHLSGATRLTEKGLAGLHKCQNLLELTLADCGVTDAGLKEVARVTWMRRLDLSGNPGVTNDGVQVLAAVKYLGWLKLEGAKVTLEGVAALRKHLPRCEFVGVPEQSRANFPLKPRFVRNRAEIEALPLDVDSVRGPGLADDDLKALARLPRLIELDLAADTDFRGDSKSKITDEGLAAIAGLKALHTLDLTHCAKVTAAGITKLSALPQLRTLRLYGIALPDEVLASIASMTALEELSIGGGPHNGPSFTDDGLARLGSLKDLQSFTIRRPKAVTTGGLKFLNGLKKIESLSLAWFEGDYELARIASAHPGLRTLSMSIDEDKAADEIGRLSRLMRLDVTLGPDVKDEAMRAFAAMPALIDLDIDLSWGIGDTGMEYLAESKTLKMLRLSGFNMRDGAQVSDAGIKHLHGMKGLKKLELVAFGMVSRDAEKALKAALPDCDVDLDN